MNYLFVNNLTVIDFSYFDSRRGIVGESWIVDIELGGDLDEQGMVFDFGLVKKSIKNLIDMEMDHRFVISNKQSFFNASTSDKGLLLSWTGLAGTYQHLSPADAVVVLDDKIVNKITISKFLEEKIFDGVPANVKSVKISLREEDIQGAYYHYSHGLKKHDGNCQRIVHGHRSRLEIYQNHQRNEELEDRWAAAFRNIYIATREDLSNETSIDEREHFEFAYQASQGSFKLLIPAKKVYFVDTDSTVEWIAAHIADQCHQQFPETHIKVKAFEGVGKGAIAVRANEY